MNEFGIAICLMALLALSVVFIKGTRRVKIMGLSFVLLLMGYVLHFGVHLAIRRSSFPAATARRMAEYGTTWWEGATQVQQRVDDVLGSVYVLAVVLALMAIAKERQSQKSKSDHET